MPHDKSLSYIVNYHCVILVIFAVDHPARLESQKKVII